MPRALAVLVLLLAGTVALALPARADEVFVLDNGMVLRGTATKETDREVVVRLSGFSDEARVTVELARIVSRRAGTAGRGMSATPEARLRPTDGPSGSDTDVPRLEGPAWVRPGLENEPLEEPGVKHEDYFERLRRVALLAMPGDRPTQAVLGLLYFAALLALVGLGSRLLEIEGVNLARASILATVLGVMVLADAIYRDDLLRADRALWMVPSQALAWLGLAFGLLRCDWAKGILLLAFLLFSLSVVAFAAGSVLVSF